MGTSSAQTPEIEWSKTFGGSSNEDGKSVQITKDGGFIIAGNKDGDSGSDIWLIKTDAYGDKEWSKFLGDNKDDEVESVLETRDGDYVVVGMTDSYGDSYDKGYIINTPLQDLILETPLKSFKNRIIIIFRLNMEISSRASFIYNLIKYPKH